MLVLCRYDCLQIVFRYIFAENPACVMVEIGKSLDHATQLHTCMRSNMSLPVFFKRCVLNVLCLPSWASDYTFRVRQLVLDYGHRTTYVETSGTIYLFLISGIEQEK